MITVRIVPLLLPISRRCSWDRFSKYAPKACGFSFTQYVAIKSYRSVLYGIYVVFDPVVVVVAVPVIEAYPPDP